MVTVHWQCSKNTSPGPYFCLHAFETEEDEQAVKEGTITAACPVCDNSLTSEDAVIGVNNEEDKTQIYDNSGALTGGLFVIRKNSIGPCRRD